MTSRKKNPGGRPTKYSGKWLKDLMPALETKARKGASKTQLAVEMGISKQTLYEWMRDNREFSDAICHLMTISQAKWEGILHRKALENAPGSDATIKFCLSNMFREDYSTERTDTRIEQKSQMSVKESIALLEQYGIDVNQIK